VGASRNRQSGGKKEGREKGVTREKMENKGFGVRDLLLGIRGSTPAG